VSFGFPPRVWNPELQDLVSVCRCKFGHWQVLTNSCNVCIENIGQNCSFLTYNTYTNCTATENKLWAAIVVTVKLIYGLFTKRSRVDVFSIVVRIAKSWCSFHVITQRTGISASPPSHHVPKGIFYFCALKVMCFLTAIYLCAYTEERTYFKEKTCVLRIWKWNLRQEGRYDVIATSPWNPHKLLELLVRGHVLEQLVKLEVLTAAKMSMLVFWVIKPCGLVGRYQHFGGTYCLHRQGWRWRLWILVSGSRS
jgi:hypothetical protein